MSHLKSYSCYLAQNIVQDALVDLLHLSAAAVQRNYHGKFCDEDGTNNADSSNGNSTAWHQQMREKKQKKGTLHHIYNTERTHAINMSSQEHAKCDTDVDNNYVVLYRDIAGYMASQIMDAVITDIEMSGQIYADEYHDNQVTNRKGSGDDCYDEHDQVTNSKGSVEECYDDQVANRKGSFIEDVLSAEDLSLKLAAYSTSAVEEIINSSSLNLLKLERNRNKMQASQTVTCDQLHNIKTDSSHSSEPILMLKVENYALKMSCDITTTAINFLHNTKYVHVPKQLQTKNEKCTKNLCLQHQETGKKSESFEVQLRDTFLHAMFSSEKSMAKGNNSKFKSKRQLKLHKKKKKLCKDLENIEVPTYDYEEMGFWTSRDLNIEMQDTLCCPVCFEVYYNPYRCMPCEHSFCEPCLRRLAKYNSDGRRDNRCPICRESISHCQPNQVLKTQVESFLPGEYQRRQKADGSGKYMCHPLPSKTTTVSLKNIARVITERNRLRQQNRAARYFGGDADVSQYNWKFIIFIILCLLCKGLILVGIIWIYNYFAKGENINTLYGIWKYLVENVWHYRDLDEESQIKVSNLFTVIAIVLVLYIALVSISSRRFAFVQR